jgi:hypothetical protein
MPVGEDALQEHIDHGEAHQVGPLLELVEQASD